MAYTYKYPHFAVTVDIVLLAKTEDTHKVLLVLRGNAPYEGVWALPGGYVDIDEITADAAMRELAEETGITHVQLKRLDVFDAINRHPNERTLSIAYMAMVDSELPATAGDDAKDTRWFYIAELPTLAFDHEEIIRCAIDRQ